MARSGEVLYNPLLQDRIVYRETDARAVPGPKKRSAFKLAVVIR